MAIDLVGDVMRDIQRMSDSGAFQQRVIKPSVEAHKEKVLKLTEQAKNPKGHRYDGLGARHTEAKKELNLKPKPDLRFGYEERLYEWRPRTRSMDTLYGSVRGKRSGQLKFKDDRGYMYDHQYGKNGMPKRKIFPEESDVQPGSATAPVVKEVENIVREYFMTPRRIKGTVRG